jgi:hypothetical protein
MMYPSRINGYIELPFTRRETVETGLGHPSAGAANIALQLVEIGHDAPIVIDSGCRKSHPGESSRSSSGLPGFLCRERVSS